MPSVKPPAYQWYVRDARSDRVFQRMTMIQQGMYRAMLDEQWDNQGQGLPDCAKACAELLGGATEQEWVDNWGAIRRKFVDRRSLPRKAAEPPRADVADASRRIINLKLHRQWRELKKFRKVKQIAGQIGGIRKAQNRRGLRASTPVGVLAPTLANASSSSVSVPASATASGKGAATPVQAFMDRYRELHEQYRGVAYLGNPQKDYMAACAMVEAFGLDLSVAIAAYGLNDRDPFMQQGTVTLTMLKSRASKYAEELKAQKLA